MLMENIYKPHEDCQIPVLAEIYQQYFGQRTDGTFVEIGAYDGVSWSNTVFLAKLGWRGVYVEPIKELADKCKEYHKDNNVWVVNRACGAKREQRLFKHNTDAPWLYTGDEEFGIVNCVNEDVGMIDVVLLDDVLEQFRGRPGFDLLVIDVEGMELEVLEGFNCNFWQPKMVIIETHELHPHSGMNKNIKQIDHYFLFKHYEKIFTSGINTIYVRKEDVETEINI